MNWLLTAGLCILLVEALVRLPFAAAVSRISRTARKAVRTLAASSVSDHWKEKALLGYAASLMASTMKLAGCLAAVGAVALLPVLVLDRLGAAVGGFLVSWTGMLFSCAVATAYLTARKLYASSRLRSP